MAVESIVNAMVVDSMVRSLVPSSAHAQQQLLEQSARDLLSEFAQLDDACASAVYEALISADDITSGYGKRTATARVMRRWWETMNGRRLP